MKKVSSECSPARPIELQLLHLVEQRLARDSERAGRAGPVSPGRLERPVDGRETRRPERVLIGPRAGRRRAPLAQGAWKLLEADDVSGRRERHGGLDSGKG